MKTWFKIKNAAKQGEPAEVLIYDEIGLWGISAKDFVDSLKNAKLKNINLRINSPGGSVFDGLAIHNYLKSLDTVNVFIDGIAASIASVIAMAGDTITIALNGFMMIHNPTGLVVGESEDMRKLADTLDKIRSSLVRTYTDRTGQSEEQVTKWMDETTWFTADEAKEHGFADEIGGEIAFQANMNVLNRFGEVPKAVGGKTTPATNKPKIEPKESKMNKLLIALAAACAIKSADADEATAVAEFKAWAAQKDADAKKLADDLKAAQDENKTLKDQAAAQLKVKAETVVKAAVKSGQIKDDQALKARWVKNYIADPEGTQELLDGMSEPKAAANGEPPVEPPAGEPKTRDDIVAKFRGMTDATERAKFYAKHEKVILGD